MPLYKQLYTYIIEEIKRGRLRRGDRIPSENELAEQFGVSRITSKKAFELLAQEKIIERSRGRGSFVSHSLPQFDSMQDEQVTPSNESMGTGSAVSQKEQRLVGFVLPHFAEAFGMRLLQSIEESCAKSQFHLVVKRTYGNQHEEEKAIRSLIQLGVDGLIVLPVHGEHYNAELLRQVLDGFPLVLIDRYLKGIDTYAVFTDNKKASRQLTELLIEMGHERIAFISPPIENTSSLEERFQGFTAAFSSRNLKPEPNYYLMSMRSTLPSSLHEQKKDADRDMLSTFMAKYPEITAFVVCEHSLALLLHQLLTERSLKVPNDCSIACFDSLKTPIGTPMFTHILQNESDIGKLAVDKLMQQIAGGHDSIAKHSVVDYKLVIGSSTGKVRWEESETTL